MKSIIEKYKKLIKNIIVKITGRNDEDLEQEVYIQVWKNLNSYEEKGKLRQWIGKISANICRDYLKSSKKRHENYNSDDEVFSNIPDKANVEESFETKRNKMIIAKAVNKLKPQLADIIIMYEIDKMSYEEISEKLNCSIGTVKSRLHSARKHLYVELKNLMDKIE